MVLANIEIAYWRHRRPNDLAKGLSSPLAIHQARFRMTCVASSPAVVWTGLKPSFGKLMPEKRASPSPSRTGEIGGNNCLKMP